MSLSIDLPTGSAGLVPRRRSLTAGVPMSALQARPQSRSAGIPDALPPPHIPGSAAGADARGLQINAKRAKAPGPYYRSVSERLTT